jgi:F0F1-type ATP synthase assembly protein I
MSRYPCPQCGYERISTSQECPKCRQRLDEQRRHEQRRHEEMLELRRQEIQVQQQAHAPVSHQRSSDEVLPYVHKIKPYCQLLGAVSGLVYGVIIGWGRDHWVGAGVYGGVLAIVGTLAGFIMAYVIPYAIVISIVLLLLGLGLFVLAWVSDYMKKH